MNYLLLNNSLNYFIAMNYCIRYIIFLPNGLAREVMEAHPVVLASTPVRGVVHVAVLCQGDGDQAELHPRVGFPDHGGEDVLLLELVLEDHDHPRLPAHDVVLSAASTVELAGAQPDIEHVATSPVAPVVGPLVHVVVVGLVPLSTVR